MFHNIKLTREYFKISHLQIRCNFLNKIQISNRCTDDATLTNYSNGTNKAYLIITLINNTCKQ